MKVMMVGPASVVHLLRWANALAERGLEISVATLHEPLPGYDPRIELIKLGPSAPSGYILAAPRLSRELAARRPDLVHVHYATGYGTLAALCGPACSVLTVWGTDVYDFPQRSLGHRWWLRRTLAAADRLTSASHAMKQVAQRFTRRPIDVVPFGVDTQQFRPGPPVEDGRLVIGTVKTMARTYGIDTLIKAAALLHADPRIPPFALRIVGGGPDRQALEDLARQLGLSEITTFVGQVSHADVPRELAHLTVAAFPSRQESFGCAAVEALACAVPVVASNVDGFNEVLAGGEFGLLVDPDDPRGLADALGTLVISPDRRRQFAQLGRDMVIARYDWQACVDLMLGTFDRTIASARAIT